MKKIICMLLCACFLLISCPAAMADTLWGTVSAEMVNMRSGPSTLDPILAELPMGTRVEVLQAGTSWHMVRYNGQNGFISRSAMTIDGQGASLPSKIYATTQQAVTLTKEPGGRATVTKLPANTKVQLVHREGDYFRVTCSKGTGYLKAQLLLLVDLTPPSGAAYSGVVTAERASLLSRADTKSTVLHSLAKGAPIEIIGFTSSYAIVRYAQTTGYMLYKSIRIFFSASTPEVDVSGQSVSFSDHPKGRIVNTKVQNFSYAMLQDALSKLRKRFPDLMTVSVLGKSTAGRDIYLVRLGNPNAPRRIWVDASLHPREHMCTQIVLNQMELLLNNASSGVFEGKRLRDVLEQVCLDIVPMGNPDGTELVQRGLSSVKDAAEKQYLLQINGGSTDFSRWKANIRGVNLVSNFDARWAEKETPDTAPAPAGYKGPAPFSEVETRLFRDQLMRGGYSMTISYHAVGAELYWWFGQEGERQARDFRVAMTFADLTGYSLISKERSLQDSAGLKDWAILTFQKPGITVELGPTTSQAPVPIGDYPQIWERNKFVLWHALNTVADAAW